MTFDGAVLKEHGVKFGVVVVKPHVLADISQRDKIVSQASRLFGGIPTVLMAQQGRGDARCYGRRDIVRFMAKVPLGAIPWKRYRLG